MKLERFFTMCLPAESIRLVLVLAVIGIPGGVATDSVISMAQCRTRCLTKFLRNEVSDSECISNPNCDSCWSACETISSNYKVFWKDACKEKAICNRGCKVACQFKKSPPPVLVGGAEEWHFPQTPAVSVDAHLHDVFIAWTQPVLKNSIPETSAAGNKQQNIVYVLLARDADKKKNNPWEQTMQTASTEAILRLYDLPYSPQFWLLAVDEHGTRTQVKFQSDISLPWNRHELRLPSNLPSREGGSAVITISGESTLNITMETVLKDGRLHPTIYWTNPSVVQASVNSRDVLSYKVDLFMNKCDCDLPPDHFEETVAVNISTQPKHTLDSILFNAHYTINVKLDSDKQWHGKLDYQTQRCVETANGDPTTCLVDTNPTAITEVCNISNTDGITNKLGLPSNLPSREGGSAVISISGESTLNITMETVLKDGRLHPTIHWTNPSVVPASVNSRDVLSYKVDRFMNECDCDLPLEHFGETVAVNISTQPKLKLDNILFNAHYTINVKLDSDKQWHGKLDYQTPRCVETANGDPTTCLVDTNSAAKTVVCNISPTADITTTDSTGNENIRDNADTSASIGNGIVWNITVVYMRYDPNTDHVHVRLRWLTPIKSTRHVKQEIVWSNVDHRLLADAGRKSPNVTTFGVFTSTMLLLKPNNVYRVYVNANGHKVSIRSPIAEICTNITDTMEHVYASRIADTDKEKDILSGIVWGVAVVASLIIVGIIILCVYKKRHSFRDIMLTKTAVAKSNSYKSNVGCKGDYSNQMLITSDDWEIDCRQLKFASPIGQGAFGKVVTGYYKDQRVAIKLVRDCAPLSYKEDLLAELNLMKRLGSHPNIVSMIGAVTLMEPICLVMEYAPYGNLQNFLKRCRLEGDVTMNGGKNPALNYSLMDEHGGINEGLITPADLLSFARQVAMAMEYLAVKKYVHRDLAARNVLLGNDKIIKVCDFGLSRDIYNDNQYKKLTNGKLPLKWMAIESLRDRVFTTQSDVWSFGILLWEIVTMGASPYPNIALADLYYLLSNHYRMEKPSNCSDELYIIMHQCWLDGPVDRPNFTDLRVQLELLLSRDRNYLELDNINVPLSTPESSSGSPVSDDTASLLAAQALQPQKSSKDELTVDVCIHDKSPLDKSVERLLKRKGEFDTHNITIL